MANSSFKCAVFDLDGVITDSAHVHMAAWKSMFDDYLKVWSEQQGIPFAEFTEHDYLEYVDGKPRYKGAKSFFDSRGVELDMGDPSDTPDMVTVCGLSNQKNALYQEFLARDGATVFPASVEFIRELKRRGIRVGVEVGAGVDVTAGAGGGKIPRHAPKNRLTTVMSASIW